MSVIELGSRLELLSYLTSNNRRRLLGFALLVILPIVLFKFHAEKALGGLGIVEAAHGYLTVFLSSNKSSEDMYAPYTEVVAAALLQPSEIWGKERLAVQMYDSQSRTLPRDCKKADIDAGAETRVSPRTGERYGSVSCAFLPGRHSDCGPAAGLRRPTCRSIRIHETIWDDARLRGALVGALYSPCKFLLNQQAAARIFGTGDTEPLQLSRRAKNLINRKRNWTGCSGSLPKATEFIILVVGEQQSIIRFSVQITPETIGDYVGKPNV